MIELYIGGVSYFIKAAFNSIFPVIFCFIPLLFLKVEKGLKISLRKVCFTVYLGSIIFFYSMQSSWITEFNKNEKVKVGDFCGLTGSVLFYKLCIDEVWYPSYKKSLDMFDDVILNFMWEELPKGCVEMHYSIKDTDEQGYHSVSIGSLKEVECNTVEQQE